MNDTPPSSPLPLPEAMAGNLQEAAKWFNQMWSGAAAPGAAAMAGPGGFPFMPLPTFDPKELEQRIADLRRVEQWLSLNQSLLQSTIQGLELQRQTLSAWQSMGAAAQGATEGGGFPAAAQWWNQLQQQFAQAAAAATAGSPAGPAAAGPAGNPAKPAA
jgi:hypothetical protein